MLLFILPAVLIPIPPDSMKLVSLCPQMKTLLLVKLNQKICILSILLLGCLTTPWQLLFFFNSVTEFDSGVQNFKELQKNMPQVIPS